MEKTAKEIERYVYKLLKESTIAESISGGVYRKGMRPRDSKLEDAVVIFTAGLSGQIQSGVITINIYVPDIDPYGNGVFVEDGKRTEELEVMAQRWVESLKANEFLFSTDDTICTDEAAEINQHFVVVKLTYRYYADDDANIRN